MAGQGSALAMIAAYVLAGELCKAAGRYEEAFGNYELRLRAYIASKQRGAERFSAAFAPRTQWGLFLRNQVIKACAIPGLARTRVRAGYHRHTPTSRIRLASACANCGLVEGLLSARTHACPSLALAHAPQCPHPCRLSRDRTSRVVSTRPSDKICGYRSSRAIGASFVIGPAAARRAAEFADHRHPFLDLGESVRIRRRRRRGGLRSRVAGVGHQPDIPPASLTIRSLGSPQAHIERALPAVSDMGVLEADDQGTEFRQRQP